MQTRTRKIWRDLIARKSRTALVATSIFIGVFGMITLISMGDILVSKLEADILEDELAMVRLFVDVKPDRGQIDSTENQEVLDYLQTELPDITIAEGLAVYPLSWKKADMAGYQDGNLFAYTAPFEEIQLEGPRLLEGRGEYPDPDARELAIEQRFASENDLEVGDTIIVRIPGETGDAAEQEWRISGIIFQPYLYQDALNQVDPATIVVTSYDNAQRLASFQGLSNIYVRFTDFATAEAQLTALQRLSAAPETPYLVSSTVIEDPAQNSFLLTVDTTQRVISLLAIVSIIVAGFLVFNVINATVLEQQKQIGVLKSLGASREDSMLIYIGLSLIYGLIGVLPAVILGIPAGYIAAQGLGDQFNTVIDEFTISWTGVLLGAGAGLMMPVLASIIPVFNGTRISIREAMTDLGISSNYGQGPFVRLINALPVPPTIRQGVASVTRKKGRTAFTIATLAVASGAFMGVLAIFSSLNDVFDTFADSLDYEFYVIPNPPGIEDAPPPSRELYDQLRLGIEDEVDNINDSSLFVFVTIDIENYKPDINTTTEPPTLFGLGIKPEDEVYRLQLVEGNAWENDPERYGIVISRPLAEALDQGVDEEIRVSVGSREFETFPIIGIVEYPYQVTWFRWQDLATLSGFVDPQGDAIPNGFLFRMRGDNHTSDEVKDTIDEVDEILQTLGITAVYTNVPLFIETNSQQLNALEGIFNLTAGLIALVGMIGLLSTLSMAVFERQREIGVMRSVGASSGTIAAQFLTEGLVIGLFAWLVGIPISYALSEVIIVALDFGDAYKLEYPPETILIGLIGTLILTIIASVSPALGAARKTVSDILRYQ